MTDNEQKILFPRENPYLIGHEKTEQYLLDTWNSSKLSSSWLITGSYGIGKATLAYRFARFILAQNALEQTSSDTLETSPNLPLFKRISSKGHADLKVIERSYNDTERKKIEKEIASGKWTRDSWEEDNKRKKSSVIKVDDIRGIGNFFSMSSAEGGWRIVIIDSADEMNDNSANAVLKMLEEPPEKALMMLISHNPSSLLPTIRSRCSQLVLRPLQDEQVFSLVRKYMPEISDADAWSLTLLAEGSIGKALAIEESGGLVLCKEMISLFNTFPNLDIVNLHAFADKAISSDNSWKTVSDMIFSWLARMIRVGARNIPVKEIISGEIAVINKFLQANSLDKWIEVREEIVETFSNTNKVNLDKKQAVINAFLLIRNAF